MDARRWIGSWPAYRQVAERDWLGLGAAVKSERSERRPRGAALRDLVRTYQQRAGITGETGTEM